MNGFARRLVVAAILGSTLAAIGPVALARVLVSAGDPNNGGYGYGYESWDNFSAALDTAAGNDVTVAPDFSNLSQMLSYDALLLNQRFFTGTLGSQEAANIATFAATGRRVLMMGENDFWTTWNNQILAIVGSSFAAEVGGFTNRSTTHELTEGVPTIHIEAAGSAHINAGGMALFDKNFATLWGLQQNVLTVLDVGVWSDESWTDFRDTFGTNVAEWLTTGPRVPEPSYGVLVGMAIGGCAAVRRQRS